MKIKFQLRSLYYAAICGILTSCSSASNSTDILPQHTQTLIDALPNQKQSSELEEHESLRLLTNSIQPSSPNLDQTAPPNPKNDTKVSQPISNIGEKTAPQPTTKVTPAPKPNPKAQTAKPVQQVTSRTQQLTLAQLVKKYPNLLLLKGSSSAKKIALTFDDAPDDIYTPQVLNILKNHHVKATFFLVGKQAEKYPGIVKRIIEQGHIIGNHSYNHKLFTKLSDNDFQTQVTLTQKSLKKLSGYTPKFLRPPYGEIKEDQLLWATNQGFTIVNWNVDSADWKQLSGKQVENNILSNTRPGSIVLQHAGGGPGQNLGGTVKALPVVIQSLTARGYKLVTLSELLQVSKQME